MSCIMAPTQNLPWVTEEGYENHQPGQTVTPLRFEMEPADSLYWTLPELYRYIRLFGTLTVRKTKKSPLELLTIGSAFTVHSYVNLLPTGSSAVESGDSKSAPARPY